MPNYDNNQFLMQQNLNNPLIDPYYQTNYQLEQYVISIDNLSKSFAGNMVLNQINLKVRPQSFHALIGENGAGKTTLIKSILGLYNDFNGDIRINGLRNTEPASRKSVYYFPAEPKFPAFLSLQKYLKLKYALIEKNSATINNDIIINLKRFKLWQHRSKNINSFSSGQKKKVMVIEALLYKAKLWILDEPTANLDPNTRREIYQIMLEQMNMMGTTIFISTHNLAEITKYVTEASFIFNGKVFWNGEINEDINLEEQYFSLLNQQMDAA